jgi:hypothetical protein
MPGVVTGVYRMIQAAMNEHDRREALMDELERLLAEYKDIPAAVVVLGTLGAALNEGLDLTLAKYAWVWCEEYIKPRVQP